MRLCISDINFEYNGTESTLSDISFVADKGDIISILGPNGAGKTTLLKCINRIHPPRSGVVLVDDEDLKEHTRDEIAKTVGYVPQRAHLSGSTVFESILIGRKPHIKWDVTNRDLKLVGRIIDIMELDAISDKPVDQISGGEYQMVQIARAVAQEPKVMLLDEPTSNLDIKNQYEVMHRLFHIIRTNDICAVMTNHDLNIALRFSNRFILMSEGKIFAAGGPEIITSENIRHVYGIDVTVGEVNGYKVIVPNELDHLLSLKANDFLSKRKKNPKQAEFFNERADTWDQMSIHDMEKVEYITNLLNIKDDSNILDVGTGTGIMIPGYLRRIDGGHVTAVDYSERMIDVARSKYPENGTLTYKVKDIYTMTEREEYDRIVCYSCFPHFPDPMGAIRVMSRALVKGGTFTIAHSSSKEHINYVHNTGGKEICNDYLPELSIMKELFSANDLDVIFTRDDDDYYIVIGIKR